MRSHRDSYFRNWIRSLYRFSGCSSIVYDVVTKVSAWELGWLVGWLQLSKEFLLGGLHVTYSVNENEHLEIDGEGKHVLDDMVVHLAVTRAFLREVKEQTREYHPQHHVKGAPTPEGGEEGMDKRLIRNTLSFLYIRTIFTRT